MKAEFEVKFEVVQKIDGAFVNYSESMSEVFKPKSKTVDYSIRTKNICKI